MLAAAKERITREEHVEVRAGAGPGHDQFPRHCVRPSRFPRRHGPEGVPADLSPARLGRARRGGDLVDAARVRAVRAEAGRRERRRHRGDRSDQPARDRRAVGPRDRGPDRQRHRLAGPPDRGAMRRASRRRAWRKRSGRRPVSFSIRTSPATKLAWLLDHVPGARARAERGELAFGTVDTWLIWNLTGGAEHVTDVSNASRTLLFNLATLQWDDELLELFGIPRSVLPRGSRVERGRRRDGPVRRRDSDCRHRRRPAGRDVRPGVLLARHGEEHLRHRRFMLMNVGASPQASDNRLLATAGWTLGGGAPAFMLEGSVFVAGAVVQWLRDGLALFAPSDDVEALARQVPDAAGVLLRARVRRARRAALGSRCARHDRRPHARDDQGPRGARGAGVDRLPVARRARSHAARRRPSR